MWLSMELGSWRYLASMSAERIRMSTGRTKWSALARRMGLPQRGGARIWSCYRTSEPEPFSQTILERRCFGGSQQPYETI